MDLFFIRHADALPQDNTSIKCDEERPLSEKGWSQASKLGAAFKKRRIVLDLLVSSPLVRAEQTATSLRTVLELSPSQIETRNELSPGGRPKKLARYLNGLQANAVGLVGHQPDLSL